MVAVGYTPGIWKLFNGERRVSLNVQFVIILSQSPLPAKLVSHGYGV